MLNLSRGKEAREQVDSNLKQGSSLFWESQNKSRCVFSIFILWLIDFQMNYANSADNEELVQEGPNCLAPVWSPAELQLKLQAIRLSVARVLSSPKMFSDTLTLHEGVNTVSFSNRVLWGVLRCSDWLVCYHYPSTRFSCCWLVNLKDPEVRGTDRHWKTQINTQTERRFTLYQSYVVVRA